MSTTLRFSSSASTTVDVIHTNALPACLPALAGESEAVDGAFTLRLVERAAASMHLMEQQLETIAIHGLDLLRRTREERQRFQSELQAARNEVEAWKRQAMAAEAGLRDATLRAWEADLYRRECEFALQQARQQAEAADKRVHDMEFYLRKIDAALRSRFSGVDRIGRPSGDRGAP